MKAIIKGWNPYEITNWVSWDNEFSEWVVAVLEITGELFDELINCSYNRKAEIIEAEIYKQNK